MTWAELHSESERLAIEAQLALSALNIEGAMQLYKQAASTEQKAFEILEVTKARTRGITATSAVALWYKANDFAVAEKLAYTLLADHTLPAFAHAELRNLVQAIWTESSKESAGVRFMPGQVMVSVKGGEVVTGGAPLDLIVDKVQTIQALFYRTIEFLKGMAHRKAGPPSREIQDACRPWLFQSVPGSYQFSVAIQKPAQQDFFRQDLEPEAVAHHFLAIVNASSEDQSAELEQLVPDETYRTTFLKLTRNLAPTGKAFERIEFRVPGESRPVGLDVEARGNINQQIKQHSKKAPPEEAAPEEFQGTLRAVHLDKDWLEVVVDGNVMHIEGLQDTVDDVIGPMVNRYVSVRATRTSKNKLKFVDIELTD